MKNPLCAQRVQGVWRGGANRLDARGVSVRRTKPEPYRRANDAEELLDAKRLREDLEAAIQRLSPMHAQTIAVFLADHDEPHVVRGVSAATWRQRLHRAIVALAAEFVAKRGA